MKKIFTRASVGLTTIAMSTFPVFASSTNTTTNALPWDGPLQQIASSMTGPVAFSIAVIAMAATGGMLVFGGELTDFTRKACMLVLAIAFLVGGAGIINTLFPMTVSGAVI